MHKVCAACAVKSGVVIIFIAKSGWWMRQWQRGALFDFTQGHMHSYLSEPASQLYSYTFLHIILVPGMKNKIRVQLLSGIFAATRVGGISVGGV